MSEISGHGLISKCVTLIRCVNVYTFLLFFELCKWEALIKRKLKSMRLVYAIKSVAITDNKIVIPNLVFGFMCGLDKVEFKRISLIIREIIKYIMVSQKKAHREESF